MSYAFERTVNFSSAITNPKTETCTRNVHVELSRLSHSMVSFVHVPVCTDRFQGRISGVRHQRRYPGQKGGVEINYRPLR